MFTPILQQRRDQQRGRGAPGRSLPDRAGSPPLRLRWRRRSADYAIHTSERRLDGYQQALREAGLDLPDAYIALGRHGLEEARQLAHRLVDLPNPPTAIFAPSDMQALGILKAARERGLSTPGDLAVVGFDDVEIADYIGLTTVRQPLEESGRVAAELLLSCLADRTRPARHVRLPLTIVKRETA